MSHLLAISVGPVQEFIAAARRTRDLWFGSRLLSEISRAVAREVSEHDAKLIFPESLAAENIANVILAELNSGEPRDVAARAKSAAEACWHQYAEKVRAEIEASSSSVVRTEVWDNQVDDVIEVYAAWVTRSGEDRYPQDRRQLMRLLSGRKNFRDFRHGHGVPGLPKSSLDGRRETVLYHPDQWRVRERFRYRLRVSDGEQLDVVGLVKRLAEGSQPYPSVSRIAADPWVRGNAKRLHNVKEACKTLESGRILRRLDTATFPQMELFPYEGTAVYVSRHHELLEETLEPDERQQAKVQGVDPLQELRRALAKLPEPNPYLAILVADGDKMGASISALQSAEGNRKFSLALAGFAARAGVIVAEHQGVLVYAGGDDVLAFLPVDQCLGCARALHEEFGERMQSYSHPTLSVGIAIGHFMENLEDLLEYGRAAERASKAPDRDGLAVHLHKRGGGPIEVRSSWQNAPDKRLTQYAELIHADAIPGKLPYELRNLHKLYSQWSDKHASAALKKDVLRVIRDKQPGGGRNYKERIEPLINEQLSDAASLDRFSRELLVAKQIAEAMRQAQDADHDPTEAEQ